MPSCCGENVHNIQYINVYNAEIDKIDKTEWYTY